MSGKPEIKLFNWKSAVMATLAGVAGASYRTYQSYQQNGHLSSVDLGVTAITIAIVCCIVTVVGWWANREE